MNDFSRRRLMAGAAAMGAAAMLPQGAHAQEKKRKAQVLIFTKHLQFIEDYEALCTAAAEIGFDGLDVAVRPKAHVLPEKVEADLPRLAEIARKHNLSIGMITTAIHEASGPETVPILKTAAALQIRNYRIGAWYYEKGKSIPDRMAEVQRDLEGIAELNRKYGLCAAYQNHSGAGDVGAPIWDVWMMIKGTDPKAMGLNFDIGHATIEGGTAWPTTLELALPRTRIVTIKDFHWEKAADGHWRTKWGPLGEGMIELPKFLKMLADSNFSGPFTLHMEYEPEDAPGAAKHSALLAAMKKDLATLRARLSEAGWA